jgi:hypothetical protein
VLNIYWDPAKFNVTGEELAEELGRNKPRVAGGETKEGKTLINTTGKCNPGNENC